MRHQVKLEVVARRNFEINNVTPASMEAGRQWVSRLRLMGVLTIDSATNY